MNNEDIIQEMEKYNFKVIEVLDGYGNLDGPFVKYEYGRGSKKVHGLSHISVIKKMIKVKEMEAEEEVALARVKELRKSGPGAINKLREAEEVLQNIRKKIRNFKSKKR